MADRLQNKPQSPKTGKGRLAAPRPSRLAAPRAAEGIGRKPRGLTETMERLALEVQQRKRAEEALRTAERQWRQTERLASLGMLVSAIAHEINNPNNFIVMNVPTIRDYLERLLSLAENAESAGGPGDFFGMTLEEFKDDIHRLLENMEHGAARISATVAKLKRFVQSREVAERRVVRMRQVVEKAVEMCHGELLSNGVQRLELEVSPEAVALVCAEDLEMILINVLINSAHAANKKDAWVKVRVLDGDPLIIEVIDNGCGMDPETKRRAFEAFFTTKPRGEGTGLGLHVCRDLADSLGAHVGLESEPDAGTTFRLTLPRGLSCPAVDPSGRPA